MRSSCAAALVAATQAPNPNDPTTNVCGICGVIGGAPGVERDRVAAMAAALAHRGPDDAGFYEDAGAVLGHRRLSIIDLAHGRQPLANEDERLWLVFNGEIYNYRELRRELSAAGHRFRTNTDGEVILHLYEEHGAHCVDRLRGMFAFAIWDRVDRRLFAARDHFGQKPLFYAVAGERLLFASEVKGLLAHGDIVAAPDAAAIDYYLGLRFVPAPLTMFRDVRKLPAAHWLEWRDGELRTEEYWVPRFRRKALKSDHDWIAELGDRIRDAVSSHLVSDVPIGAFLSGGIDSSLVVAAMREAATGPVRTFCVGSPGQLDERSFARDVAEHLGTLHHEAEVSSRLLDGIPHLVQALDEPSDPIAACMYEASRLAAAHVKVVLGGDGGDEMFAGFDRYAAFPWVDRYASLPRWVREDLLRPVLGRWPDAFGYKSMGQRARWLNTVAMERGGRSYARMTSHFRFGPEEKQWLYGPALRAAVGEQDALAAVAEPFRTADAGDALHRMLYADIVTRLPEHTLMLTDRMSMAHGLETRAPLLDRGLADFCATMPARLKIRGRATKHAARLVARQWLPKTAIERPKQGFMFPVADWLAGPLLDSVAADLRGGALVREGWVAPEAIERLLGEHRRRVADHHVRIWMLLNLEAWYGIYLSGAPGIDEPGSLVGSGAA